MITNPGVFDDDYLPNKLLHREADTAHLSRAFEPTLDGEPAENILLFGPSGVGKTALVRYALAELDSTRAVADNAYIRTSAARPATSTATSSPNSTASAPLARRPLRIWKRCSATRSGAR